MTDLNGIPKLASSDERRKRFEVFTPASDTKSPDFTNDWREEVFKDLSSFEEKDIREIRTYMSFFKREKIKQLLNYLSSFEEKDIKNILIRLASYQNRDIIESPVSPAFITKEMKEILNYLSTFKKEDIDEVLYYLSSLKEKDLTDIRDYFSSKEKNIKVILARLPSLPPDVKGADPVLVRAHMLNVINYNSGPLSAGIPRYLNCSMKQCYSQLWEDIDVGKELWKQIKHTRCPVFGDLSQIYHYDLEYVGSTNIDDQD